MKRVTFMVCVVLLAAALARRSGPMIAAPPLAPRTSLLTAAQCQALPFGDKVAICHALRRGESIGWLRSSRACINGHGRSHGKTSLRWTEGAAMKSEVLQPGQSALRRESGRATPRDERGGPKLQRGQISLRNWLKPMLNDSMFQASVSNWVVPESANSPVFCALRGTCRPR
jgi:hypothetical protein